MKKTVKSILAFALMAVVLVTLAGCGNKEEAKKADENKLVATKQNTGDSFLGDYKEIIEVTFKDDKAEKIVMKMELADEETASSFASLYTAYGEDTEGLDVKAEGKNLVMTMDAATFMEEEGIDGEDSSLTKEEIKKALEEEGYTIEQ